MPLSVQLQEREDFEVRTLRALGGGAAVGLAVAAASRMHLHLDMTFFAVAGAAVASARADWKVRLGMLVGLPVLLNIPEVLNVPTPLSEACMGTLAAGVVGLVGTRWKPKPLQVLAGAVGAGMMVPLGLYVKTVMDARFFDGRLGAVGAVVGLAAVALFWSVGTLAAHVRVHGNAVEARGTALEKQLSGEAQGLVSRAVTLYGQCQKEAARLTAGPGKTELVGVLEKMAREVFSLAESHAQLEAQLRAVQQGDVDAQVQELRAKAAATTDAVARRQLELAASSLGEELNHLDILGRKRERMLAQLHAQVALLERARVSLVGVQGGDVASKGEQAAQLARKLAALGQEDSSAPAAPAPLPESTKVLG
ncbi:hypothetical protein [Vitiosangium sp. GDMCC 1.1324]|uniref:hypothetical protein n=1 Tax=Vitiosangium sp. (strain GDMCC 1.1324) TaxID=2138576 RepID=UPI000D3BBC3E|nr:hypothetical protein [Vitiosangium sp. GDMCC 1.1324]PTL84864.1 hypothetical protein DAT35_07355 [Vitiosangium sp. GDMCC 1.1324]